MNFQTIDDLLPSYDRYIRYFIRKYHVNRFDYDDLYQAGLIGLYQAYKHYDKTSNVKFSTFAFKYIFGSINKEYTTVIANYNVKYEKIRKFIENNDYLSYKDIASKLKISLNDVILASTKVDIIKYDEIDFQANKTKYKIDELNKTDKDIFICLTYKHLSQKQLAIKYHTSQSSISRKYKDILQRIKE